MGVWVVGGGVNVGAQSKCWLVGISLGSDKGTERAETWGEGRKGSTINERRL